MITCKPYENGIKNKVIIDYVGPRDDPTEMMYFDLKEDGTQLNQSTLSHMVKREDGQMTSWIRDPRPFYCAICGHGWVNTCASLKDAMFLSDAPKDPTGKRKECVHKKCYLGHLARVQHELFYWSICEGRIRDGIRMIFDGFEEMPNQYGGAYDTPWYKTHITGLSLGKSGNYEHVVFCTADVPHPWPHLVVGRRKRVYSLTLTSPTPLVIERNEETKCLFDDEVTRAIDDKDIFDSKGLPVKGSEILIHAWTDEKVKEYFNAFCSILFDTDALTKKKEEKE